MKGLAAIVLVILVYGHIYFLVQEIKHWNENDWSRDWIIVAYVIVANIAIILTALAYFGIISTEQ